MISPLYIQIIDSISKDIESNPKLQNISLKDIENSIFLDAGRFSDILISKSANFVIKTGKKDTNISIIKNEWDILNNIDHPHIIKLMSNICFLDNKYCFALELGGYNLCNIIMDSGPIKESVAKIYFIQLVDAINYLHNIKIAHCDIKPDNIVVLNNQIKLIDFSHSIKINTSEDYQKYISGTDYYIAPEVIISIIKHTYYNAFISDIYALGATLFSMVTSWHYIYNYLDNIRNNNILKKQIGSEKIYDILKKMTQINPEKRIKMCDILNHEFIYSKKRKIDYI